MARCKSCGAEIIWIRTIGGKQMPCDPEPVPYWERLGASDRIVTANGEVLACEFEGDGAPTGRGHISHMGTCPQADKHRRR